MDRGVKLGGPTTEAAVAQEIEEAATKVGSTWMDAIASEAVGDQGPMAAVSPIDVPRWIGALDPSGDLSDAVGEDTAVPAHHGLTNTTRSGGL